MSNEHVCPRCLRRFLSAAFTIVGRMIRGTYKHYDGSRHIVRYRLPTKRELK